MKTYFMSWLRAIDGNQLSFGNAVAESDLTGRELIRYLIDALTAEVEGAVIINIVSL